MSITSKGGKRRTAGGAWPEFPRLPASLRASPDAAAYDREIQEMWQTFRGLLDRVGVDGRDITIINGGPGLVGSGRGAARSGTTVPGATTGTGVTPRGPLTVDDGPGSVSAEGGRFLTRIDGTRVFYQDVPPSEGKAGDLWFDTDDSYKPYVFKDGRWQSIFDDVPTLAGSVGGGFDARAILAEANARADALLAERNARDAAIEDLRTLLIDETNGESLASQFQVLDALVRDSTTGLARAHARITSEQTVRTTADSALASSISTVSVDLDTAEAAIVTEENARISADGSLAAEYVLSVLTTAAGGFRRVTGFRTTSLNGGTGATEFVVQTDKFVIVDTSGSEQTSGSLVVGATYVISKAGGTFTGVGAANNNVNTQFIASGTTPTWGTGAVVRYTVPFKVTGGQVYIDKAVITEVTAGSILAGTISVALTLDAATINSGVLNSPLITGSLFRFSGACTMCCDTADSSDTGILRVNGGGSDGPTRGGQIDYLGNEYTTVPGFNGSILVTPGDHANGSVHMRDRTAADRFVIETDGTITMATDVTCTTLTETSSRRFKTNIRRINNALGSVRKLRGVTFDWKSGRLGDVGLIAEELESVFPALVSRDRKGRAKAANYGRLSAVLIEAVKEMDRRVARLEILK